MKKYIKEISREDAFGGDKKLIGKQVIGNFKKSPTIKGFLHGDCHVVNAGKLNGYYYFLGVKIVERK